MLSACIGKNGGLQYVLTVPAFKSVSAIPHINTASRRHYCPRFEFPQSGANRGNIAHVYFIAVQEPVGQASSSTDPRKCSPKFACLLGDQQRSSSLCLPPLLLSHSHWSRDVDRKLVEEAV